MFSGVCQNSRDCYNDQTCIRGTCRLICNANNSCPDSFACVNKICTKNIICSSNSDCSDDEICAEDLNGIPKCIKVCENQPCGRNAYCTASSHEPICKCTKNFFGDPVKGCERKECDDNKDCSEDKFCDNSICKIACLASNECGDNTICASENHKRVCYCQPGFTGDPLKGCTEMNWCNLKPCGNGAECVNSRISAKCTCPPGTIGNPYEEGCRKSSECRFNRDCPPAARCSVIEGIRKCTGTSQFLYS